jgi:general secretion pathway protein I
MMGEPSGGRVRVAVRGEAVRRPRRALNWLEDGFTLLEVLVAFAILSIAVVVAIQGFAAGLRLLRLSGDHQQAMLLADQKVREVLNAADEPERKEDADGPFKWERTVTAVPAPDLMRTPVTEKWHVYRIAVKVSWGDKRHVELATLRASGEKPPPPGAPQPGAPAPGARR